MKNQGIGGMQTCGLNYSLMCPKCGKPAYRMEKSESEARYFHFTKKGSTKHVTYDPAIEED